MTASVYRPTDLAQLQDLVTWAMTEGHPLEVRGQGTKAGLGVPVNTEAVLDMTGFSGIDLYEPAELVLTAGAGTPMAELDATLAASGQQFAFEPPDLGPLLGSAGAGTLGGVVACNLGGPRRIHAGAARDHFLGFQGVSGRGESFKAGGRVVKNVTGFDLCKLMAGSMGTLTALATLTMKVLPAPETVGTVLVLGLSDADAMTALSRALGSSHEVTAAAHIPGGLVGRVADCTPVSDAGQAVTALRLEGPGPSVAYRGGALRGELADLGGETAVLETADSRGLWRSLRDVLPVVEPRSRAVWRLSATPTAGAAVVAEVARQRAVDAFYDWGGGLIWLATEEAGDGGAAEIRAALEAHGGGHATLVRGSAALRAAVPVFQPQPAPLAAVARRVKEGFDPKGVLTPGRMVLG